MSNNLKWYSIQLYLQWPTNRKSYTIYRMAPFSMTLNDPYPQFQGHATPWCWISQKRYDIHSVIEILIGTYTRPMQQCHSNDLEWLSKIFNDTKRRAVSLRQLIFVLSTQNPNLLASCYSVFGTHAFLTICSFDNNVQTSAAHTRKRFSQQRPERPELT